MNHRATHRADLIDKILKMKYFYFSFTVNEMCGNFFFRGT